MQAWTHEKLRRFLEGGIMPNLFYAIEFALDEAVQDVILVQGVVCSITDDDCYVGPMYLPPSVRQMKLPVSSRSRDCRTSLLPLRYSAFCRSALILYW